MPTDAVQIRALTFKQSFFKPGETARWTVTLRSSQAIDVTLVTEIRKIDQVVATLSQPVAFGPGEWSAELRWQPPADAPHGYGLDVSVRDSSGNELARSSSAFDVLEKWTQNPRYGFMTDFEPNRSDGAQALDRLLPYRINGLQFYDWMYRHEQYLTDSEPYTDLLGRRLSRKTVEELITLAHERNMAAMPYTAVYGASMDFYKQHPDWALLEPNGKPSFFGDNFLVIMDPRPDSPWTNHLVDQFDQILSATDFDGIHLDQYGAPKEGYTPNGEKFTLDQPLADLINSTAQVVNEQRGEAGTVVFNAVTNWPIETVAPSDEDLVYIEVWSPYTFFNDLASLVAQGQTLGGGKPVVIAAYVPVSAETNAILNDAIIFASGAAHIEMGEQGGYLADPYFPKYELPSQELAERLQRYYLFALRYQNVLGPTTQAGAAARFGQIRLPGYETAANVTRDKILPLVRSSQQYTAVSLVNLMGLPHGEWAAPLSAPPTPQADVTVIFENVTAPVKAVWFATPDHSNLELQAVEFEQVGSSLTVQAPALDYWSVLLLEWSE